MYEKYITDVWGQDYPFQTKEPSYLNTEPERWAKLLEQPIFLANDLREHGPLTVDGYLRARRLHKKKEAYWPVTPEGVAKLLITCAITLEDAAYAAIEQANYALDDEHWFATMLLTHIEILGHLKSPLSFAHLEDILFDINWGHTSVDEYRHGFKIMHRYLGKDEISTFLTKWLPKLNSNVDAYGVDSLGVALAQSFEQSDPVPLSQWCRCHGDQQGLGYLVWQNRIPFRDWLSDVARPTYDEGREANWRNDADNCRSMELVATFSQLIKKMPLDYLQQEYQSLLLENPGILNNLIKRAHNDPHSTSSISWVACLSRIGALTINHPDMIKWFELAHESQSIALGDKQRMKYTSGVSSDVYFEWSIAFGSHGSSLRNFLAQHMVTNLDVSQYQREDISWLTEAPLAQTLISLPAPNGEQGRSHPTLVALFPCLSRSDMVPVGMHILLTVVLGYSSAKYVLNILTRSDPDFYKGAIILPGDDAMSLLRAMTKQDTKPLSDMLNGFDIGHRDALFDTTVRNWLQSALAIESTPNVLPELDVAVSVF
jgi:hypothetical protein